MRRLTLQSSSARTRRKRRAYWRDVTPSLGCGACPSRATCGGLRDLSRRNSCLDDCCGGDSDCDIVCSNHPDFPLRMLEIDGYEFQDLPAGLKAVRRPALPKLMPMIYHGNRRLSRLVVGYAALPLFRLISRRDGSLLHADAAALRSAYRLNERTRLYLSGVDRDAPLEEFWAKGTSQRRATFAALRDLGICGVSGPNYSTFTDIPRMDPMHALKRITLAFEDMLWAEVPGALHLNGIFDEDYERTSAWIEKHQIITDVAADFGTGSRGKPRGEQHARWIADLGEANNGRLRLVMRGGARWLPILLPAFASVTIIDTTSFLKTMYRQRFSVRAHTTNPWRASRTPLGAPLDRLLAHNIEAFAAHTLGHGWGVAPGR